MKIGNGTGNENEIFIDLSAQKELAKQMSVNGKILQGQIDCIDLRDPAIQLDEYDLIFFYKNQLVLRAKSTLAQPYEKGERCADFIIFDGNMLTIFIEDFVFAISKPRYGPNKIIIFDVLLKIDADLVAKS